MKLSKKKKQQLYDAIAMRILNLRVKASGTPGIISHLEIDNWLFQLEQDVWKGVTIALDLNE